jgi:ABC-type multidrug transport system fused ATPase/permease subunit
MPEGSISYPATFSFDPPDKVANWRPLVNWLLAIPHYIVLYALQVVSRVVGVISWFAIVFTGRLPEGLANVQVMYLRYSLRTSTFVAFLREEYPPFGFATTTSDPGDDRRTRVEVQPQLADRNRLTALFRIVLVIPQLIVLAILSVASAVATFIAVFAVLFTGRWPAGMRGFVLKVLGWSLRLNVYFLLLTDVYPPFALS